MFFLDQVLIQELLHTWHSFLVLCLIRQILPWFSRSERTPKRVSNLQKSVSQTEAATCLPHWPSSHSRMLMPSQGCFGGLNKFMSARCLLCIGSLLKDKSHTRNPSPWKVEAKLSGTLNPARLYNKIRQAWATE